MVHTIFFVCEFFIICKDNPIFLYGILFFIVYFFKKDMQNKTILSFKIIN